MVRKKEKKSGWVWWVTGKSHAWHGGNICNGPYDTLAEARKESNWNDKIIRKARGAGCPAGFDED